MFQFAPQENFMSAPHDTPLLTTPLNALHVELGARMVPFAGYSMPVQYPAGLMAEHLHTRTAAGLFDVSHMGQLRLVGADAAAAFETLMPVDVIDLPVGKQRYGLLLNDEGGIIDDLMFVNRGARPLRHRQRRLQGGRHRPHPGPHRPALPGHPDARARAAGPAGPAGGHALARLVPGVENWCS
jgi:aminomethyltransferase